MSSSGRRKRKTVVNVGVDVPRPNFPLSEKSPRFVPFLFETNYIDTMPGEFPIFMRIFPDLYKNSDKLTFPIFFQSVNSDSELTVAFGLLQKFVSIVCPPREGEVEFMNIKSRNPQIITWSFRFLHLLLFSLIRTVFMLSGNRHSRLIYKDFDLWFYLRLTLNSTFSFLKVFRKKLNLIERNSNLILLSY